MKVHELQQLLRDAEPAAVLVSPRVLERVIQQVYQLPGVLYTIPHRYCFVVDRGLLFRHVEQDELNLDHDHLLPATVILLSRPQGETLSFQDRPALLRDYWRRLFHASVHLVLSRRTQEGRLEPEHVRSRIDVIGAAEFDEIRTVLQQDSHLLPAADDRAVYIEFCAVYLELRHFAPHLLNSHFPGIRDFTRIDALLVRDLDPNVLFARTRLKGAPDPVPPTDTGSEEAHDFYFRLIRSAERASQGGNNVRAAIQRTRAARVAPVSLAAQTRIQAEADIHRLVKRLQAALQLSDEEVIQWARVLPALLDKADQGNRPVEAALLDDLQEVCIDHEREIYTLDLVECVQSGGRRPIKRPLPSQRVVRITKHLRSAVQRLAQARLSDTDREHLDQLLQGSLQATEERLRIRFRPLIENAFRDVGLQPTNPPEQTASRKVIEEILDRISAAGFLTFGDLRDTLSRNQLKLPDLDDPQSFIQGDPLLRLDRRLATLLDGVYRPSEVYTRWLERLTALSFGTGLGRALTRCVLLPFVGAAALVYTLGMVLEGLMKLPEQFRHFFSSPRQEQFHLQGIAGAFGASAWIDLVLVACVGCFFLGLIHSPGFRRRCRQTLYATFRLLRAVLIRFPSWAVQVTGVRALVSTWPFQLCYWYLCKPLVLGGVLWVVWKEPFATWPGVLAVFAVASFLINSRLGQATGEILFRTLVSFYELLRAGLLTGLYRLVVHVFKRIMDMVEYILFSVDEWLRYRGGEGWGSLVVRSILGALWFPVSWLARFYTVVLIEPMLNPIKLPISCLAAKFVYPLVFAIGLYTLLTDCLTPVLGSILANAITVTTVYLLPDAVGFLFWETKENWSLYEANRQTQITAVPVGSHGETVLGLLHPGFHSGTIPKLFTRLRRAEWDAERIGNWRAARAAQDALHEVRQTVQRFVQRDLIVMLQQDPAWKGEAIRTGRVILSINRIRFELVHPSYPEMSVWLEFEDRSAWLLASVWESGWLGQLSAEQRLALARCLINFYKLAGVDVVREQVRACLPARAGHHDIVGESLLVYNGAEAKAAVRYDLMEYNRPFEARTSRGGRAPDWPQLPPKQLLFSRVSLTWKEWVASWQSGNNGRAEGILSGSLPSILIGSADTLPEREAFTQPVAVDTVIVSRKQLNQKSG
jgi:hypothetical protein